MKGREETASLGERREGRKGKKGTFIKNRGVAIRENSICTGEAM